MRDEKEERSKHGQTNNKAKQHSTPKVVTFPKKNELVWVGPTTLYPLDSDSTAELPRQLHVAGWAQISHLIHVAHLMNSIHVLYFKKSHSRQLFF